MDESNPYATPESRISDEASGESGCATVFLDAVIAFAWIFGIVVGSLTGLFVLFGMLSIFFEGFVTAVGLAIVVAIVLTRLHSSRTRR